MIGTLMPDDDDHRVEVGIVWENVPEGFDDTVLIHLRSTAGDYEVHLPVSDHRVPAAFHGFVESDGHVSDRSGSRTARRGAEEVLMTFILSWDAVRPALDSSQAPPSLSYTVYLFSDRETEP